MLICDVAEEILTGINRGEHCPVNTLLGKATNTLLLEITELSMWRRRAAL